MCTIDLALSDLTWSLWTVDLRPFPGSKMIEMSVVTAKSVYFLLLLYTFYFIFYFAEQNSL